MNLTLAQLNSDLSRIHAHGLAETNVTEIQHTPGGGVFFTVDTSKLQAELAESKATEARLDKQLDEAIEELEAMSVRIDKLTRRLRA